MAVDIKVAGTLGYSWCELFNLICSIGFQVVGHSLKSQVNVLLLLAVISTLHHTVHLCFSYMETTNPRSELQLLATG